jgi:cysteine desulfurase
MLKSNSESGGKTGEIYMDYASSALASASNPGAIHALGVKEKNKLEKAREAIAKILHANKNEVIFTSGATESNNLAILGLVHPFLFPPHNVGGGRVGVPHVVTTNIEHASVLEVCRHLERSGKAEVTYVQVEKNGIVDAKKIKKALKENTVLVSVMYANNEIGTIQPIREIARDIRHFKKTNSREIFFHTDAAQAVNYLPVNVAELGVDLLSMSSAKIYGPKGIGALYVKKNTPLEKIMFGGDQEFGLRPGTENPALALAFSKAMETAEKMKDKEVVRLTGLRDHFFKLLKKLSRTTLDNGDAVNRLPNNINITVPNIPSDLLVIELSEKGIMASAKSACKAGDGKSSHVIKAINKDAREQDGSLRFSLGRYTSKQEVERTVKTLSSILHKLKKWY